ncbi:MAG: DUF177 domain-containing protein [Mycobacteriales bacterium]|nr:DUF177 domain-containing protein [Frankia sp.]
MPETRRHAPHLDPRAPLVLDTRELARRPGTQRQVDFDAPAPADIGTPLIGVAAGAPMTLALRLESVMEGVLVSGTATVALVGECGRCLDPVASTLDVDLLELYAYAESDATEDEASRLDGDFLDLEPVVRDAVVLALPLTPLCNDDCPGLCVTCGARLADVAAGHSHDVVDPRWDALRNLAGALPDDGDGHSMQPREQE